MYVVNDICYAGEMTEGIKVTDAFSTGHGIVIVTFSTGEKRLLDVTELKGSAFKPLLNDDILKDITVFHGILTWKNGEIDIAPETVYEMSYPYSDNVKLVI